jgi:transketolase
MKMNHPKGGLKESKKILFEKKDVNTVMKCQWLDIPERLSTIADMMRLNTLTAIAYARSGHIGASFSIAEILVALYHHIMNVEPSQDRPARDKFVLSKGHAAAMLYSVLASKGFIPENKLLKFRRLGGLEGHVDMSVPGVDANTGSLGMGISKAKGYALAHKMNGTDASIFVLVGDGELQEGQNWEAIQSAAFLGLDNLYLIVDKNQVQTDMKVEDILDISPVEEKLKTFHWHVVTINGHNVREILSAFGKLKKTSGKPKAIIANTVKGKGVSFMEHPAVLAEKKVYKWHDKIPSEEEYALAWDEIASRVRRSLERYKVQIRLPSMSKLPREEPPFKGQSLVRAFAECLVRLGEKNEKIVVLDADLAECCGLRKFQEKFPERFIEIGIAEQDMVSTAGGLALLGKLPIVNTFAAFLTSRSNEQIFNNVSEGSKVIYVGHLAGLLPAKPGKSHQGLRDISLLKSVPNLLMCQPCNAIELQQLLEFLVFDSRKSGYLRLEHFPPRRNIELPRDHKVEVGKGVVIAEGEDVVIIGYGALLLSEALLAREELEKIGVGTKIVNLPWLNEVNKGWLLNAVGNAKIVVNLENHAHTGGQSEEIMRALWGCPPKFYTLGVEGFGLTGDGEEILEHHGLDWKSIATKINRWLKR